MNIEENEYIKFLWLVEQMRIYQRDYFKTRSGYSLKKAIELEKQVDVAIAGLNSQVIQLKLLL